MTTTTEELPQLLKNLRLRKMAAILESELQAARKSSPSYSDFLVRLLRAEWLDQQERKFIGPTGVGKTGLASGLLLKALQNGYRALFIKAQDLFDEMYASLADRASRKLVRRLARIDVLLVDELAYLNLRPEQTNIFFKLMEERYRRKATLITTNLEYDQWHQLLGNKDLTEALLSRLRHQCQTIRINGPSLREPQG